MKELGRAFTVPIEYEQPREEHVGIRALSAPVERGYAPSTRIDIAPPTEYSDSLFQQYHVRSPNGAAALDEHAPTVITSFPLMPLEELTDGKPVTEGHVADAITLEPGQFTGMTESERLKYINALHVVREHGEEYGPMGEVTEGLQSFDAFKETFGKGLTPQDQQAFGKAMRFFTGSFLHPSRIVSATEFAWYRFNSLKPINKIAIYDGDQEEWVAAPAGDYRHVREVTTKEVLDEARGLPFEAAGRGSEYYTATNSGALDGILGQGALLGTEEMRRRGITPKTGAYREELLAGDTRVWKNAVYASRSFGVSAYAAPEWFDDYGVTFAVDTKKQNKYIQQEGVRTNTFNYGYDPEGSGGQMLGPVVPLENVPRIYVAHKYRDTLAKKLAEQGCDIPVVSAEAAMIQRDYGRFLRRGY
jgi:hypothetical protein